MKLPRDAKQPGQKPARARSASATAPLAVSELSSADDDLDALWSQCRSDRRVVFIRDRDWVTWRYLSSPMIHYRVFAGRRHGELVAWLAVHVTEPANAAGPSLTILDLVAPDHRDAEQLLATTLDLFRRAGAIKAQALVVPGSTRHALFRRAGFLFRRDVLLLQARPMHRSPAIEDLRALDISGGDFDFT